MTPRIRKLHATVRRAVKLIFGLICTACREGGAGELAGPVINARLCFISQEKWDDFKNNPIYGIVNIFFPSERFIGAVKCLWQANVVISHLELHICQERCTSVMRVAQVDTAPTIVSVYDWKTGTGSQRAKCC